MAGLNENPFADPFAQQTATRNGSGEEFNPFAAQQRQQPSPSSVVGGGSTTSGGVGTKPASTAVPITSDELFRQQEELRKREQELQRRQAEFERRQQSIGGTIGGGGGGIGGGGGNVPKPHNWPPMPTFVPLEPCFYQDIDVEIPVQFQETVRMVYYVYLVYVLALVANVFGSLFYTLFADGSFGFLFLGVIQLVLFTPCAYLFWFRSVYKAFRDDSSFNFMVFFAVLFFHAIFTFIQTLGLSQYACGWSNTIHALGTHTLVGLIMLPSTLAFTAAFAGMVLSLVKVHRFYRGAGFSIEKARKEFSEGVMSDRNVQTAASQAARAATAHAVNEVVAGRY